MPLRPYQQQSIENLNTVLEQYDRVLFILPTAAGKTTIFSELIKQRQRALVLVHREELMDQARNRLSEEGILTGVYGAGRKSLSNYQVNVAIVDTLIRMKNPPPADFIVCDEAHLSIAPKWARALSIYPHAKVLGVTATPWRLGSGTLSDFYQTNIIGATPAELCKQGYLAPYEGFHYESPDLEGIKTVQGDYEKTELEKRTNTAKLAGDILEQWKKHAEDRSTVVFAVSIEHSKRICEEFLNAGISAEHLDGTTSKAARAATLARVNGGATRVLCNVGIAAEGLDIPRLKCAILARPTQSLSLVLQQIGRVRRPWGGITARIHDHAFNILNHGLPDQERVWSPDAPKKVKPRGLRFCMQCGVYYETSSCPNGCITEKANRELDLTPDHTAVQIAFDHTSEAPYREISGRIKWDKAKRIQGTFRALAKHPTENYSVAYFNGGSCSCPKALLFALQKATDGERVFIDFLGERQLGKYTEKVFKVTRGRDSTTNIVENLPEAWRPNSQS